MAEEIMRVCQKVHFFQGCMLKGCTVACLLVITFARHLLSALVIYYLGITITNNKENAEASM